MSMLCKQLLVIENSSFAFWNFTNFFVFLPFWSAIGWICRYGTLEKVRLTVRICILLLLGEKFYKCWFNFIGWQCWALTDLGLIILYNMNRKVLKSLIVDLFISPFSFLFTSFEAQLFNAYTLVLSHSVVSNSFQPLEL